jgi:hypothetical protein
MKNWRLTSPKRIGHSRDLATYEELLVRLSLVACCLSLVGCAGLRLFQGNPESASYFPLRVGDEWDYRLVTFVTLDGTTDTTTVGEYHHAIVGKCLLADSQPAFIRVWTSQVTLRNPGLKDSTFSETETTYLRRTGSAVYRYFSRDDRPDSVLLLPVAIDRQWNSRNVRYWVMAREDITAGGQFYPESWRVKTTSLDNGAVSNTWFCRGKGMVRFASDREFSGKKLHTEYWLRACRLH